MNFPMQGSFLNLQEILESKLVETLTAWQSKYNLTNQFIKVQPVFIKNQYFVRISLTEQRRRGIFRPVLNLASCPWSQSQTPLWPPSSSEPAWLRTLWSLLYQGYSEYESKFVNLFSYCWQNISNEGINTSRTSDTKSAPIHGMISLYIPKSSGDTLRCEFLQKLFDPAPRPPACTVCLGSKFLHVKGASGNDAPFLSGQSK